MVALRWAAWFAVSTGRGLWVVHAWQYGGQLDTDFSPPADAGDLEPAIEAHLSELTRKELHGDDPATRFKSLRGPVPAALVREAHDNGAAIIVVGARQQRRFPAHLGSVSRQLTECPTLPIAVVPYHERRYLPGEGSYLVGVDGSDHSARAVRWTAHAAGRGGNDVVAVHAFEHSYQDLSISEEKSLESEAMERFEQEWCAPLAAREVPYESRFERGAPKDVLTDVARSIEPVALVVGTRGLSPPMQTVLGSVTRHLLRSLDLPTVVIPGPKDCQRWRADGVIS